MKARVAELDNALAVCANKVVMLLVAVGFLVVRALLREAVLNDKVAFKEELEAVVERRSAYALALFVHLLVEVIDAEVRLLLIDKRKGSVSLRCLT